MLKKYHHYILLLLGAISLTPLQATEEKAQDKKDIIKQVSYSPLKGHTDTVTSVAITSDNKYIVSSSHDKTIRS